MSYRTKAHFISVANKEISWIEVLEGVTSSADQKGVSSLACLHEVLWEMERRRKEWVAGKEDFSGQIGLRVRFVGKEHFKIS